MRLKNRNRRNNRVWLSLERLEDRCTPATISVANTAQLQSALRSVGNFDTILLQPGNYSVVGATLNANLLSVNMTIKAANPNTVAIDGGLASPLISILNPFGNPGTQIQFQNITFQNGVGTPNAVSGGVSVENANVTFTQCIFQGNLSYGSPGGGALIIYDNSTAHFTSCTFQANGSAHNGGAMEIINGPNVIIDESVFVGNSTKIDGSISTSEGGAIAIGTTLPVNTTVTINNTRFDSNQAADAGGAIHSQGVFQAAPYSPNTFLNLNNCTFVNNSVVRAVGSLETQGGAVSVEDATLAKIGVCRFIDNFAESGGAVQMYRSSATIDQSYFEFNRATNGGGGAISMASISMPTDFGKPKANLTITNSFILGDPNGASLVGNSAGGIGVGGDRRSFLGLDGVPQNGSLAQNQATLVATNVVFANLRVQQDLGIPGTGIGGAISADLGNVTVNNSLFMNCEALAADNNLEGSFASGGAIAAVSLSAITVTGSTFSNNVSSRFGGAIWATGSELNVNQDSFIGNSVTFSPNEFDSQGAAIYTAGDPPSALDPAGTPATGTVQNSIFSGNQGMTIYENDSPSGSAINLMTYNGNQIFATSFGNDVYFNAVFGAATVSKLNQLVLHGQAKSPLQNNQALTFAPPILQLFGAPDRIYTFTAAGDSSNLTHNDLAFVASGVQIATLKMPDGSTTPIAGPNGFLQVNATGTYILSAALATSATKAMIQPTLLIAGADQPAGAYVPVFDALTGQQVRTLLVYDPFFSGGARVAMGDITGDGAADFIVAAGPGGGPNVKVFDGVTGVVIRDFFAYAPNFTGGSYVAAGNVTGGGLAEIIIGADTGGGPNVKVFDSALNTIVDFFAFESTFTGGARVAAAHLSAGAAASIIAAKGPGGNPLVSIFNFNGTQTPALVSSFLALPAAFTGGVFIAAGDVAGLGRDFLISGAAPGGGPNVTVVDPTSPSILLESFFALPAGFTGGVRVAGGAVRNGLPGPILAGAGPGGGPNATAFAFQQDNPSPPLLDSFFVFDPTFSGGIYVASA